MRGARLAAGLVAIGGVVAAAPGQGAVLPLLDVSEPLIEQRVTPAALVPTYVPPLVGDRFGSIQRGSAQRRVYSLRVLHQPPSGTDGVVLIGRCLPIGAAAFGTCAGLTATRRHYVRQGFRARATRIRSRPGVLLTRPGPRGPERLLIWREDGLVHTIGSATPRKAPLRELRRTAAGLRRLEHRYVGSSPDPNSSASAILVVGEGFAAGRVDWVGVCAGPAGSLRGGGTDLALVARTGDTFSADIAGTGGASGWSGTISGTVSPTAIVLNISATGVFNGLTCTTGALSFTLPQFDKGI